MMHPVLIKWLSHPYAKKLIYFIMGIMALWILINLIETGMLIFYRPTAITSESTVNNTSQPPLPLNQIANWHLFGQPPLSAANTQNIPISSVDLTLNGIFYQTNSAKSSVLMANANGQTQLYRIGDTLPGGVTLYEIRPDSVILEHNNQLEKLMLPNRQLQFGPAPEGLQ